VQDVPGYLARKELSVPCYFDETRTAVLDAAHAVRLNYETFLFSDASLAREFAADPVRYCGLLTDPVSRRRFRPRSDSPRVEDEGVVYFFECAGTQARFRADPAAHRLPGYTM
jgi:YHS domain-containing protein